MNSAATAGAGRRVSAEVRAATQKRQSLKKVQGCEWVGMKKKKYGKFRKKDENANGSFMCFQGCFGLADGIGAVAENKSYSAFQARGEPHAVATASQAEYGAADVVYVET